jgi:hypothetical protein
MFNKGPLPKLVLVNSKNHNHFSWLRLATVSTGFESAAGFFRCFRRLHLFFHGCQGHCRDINRYNHQKGPIVAFGVILCTSLALDSEWQVLLLIRKNTGAWPEIEAQWVRVFCLVARTLLRWSSSLRTLDIGKNVFKFVWSYFNFFLKINSLVVISRIFQSKFFMVAHSFRFRSCFIVSNIFVEIPGKFIKVCMYLEQNNFGFRKKFIWQIHWVIFFLRSSNKSRL